MSTLTAERTAAATAAGVPIADDGAVRQGALTVIVPIRPDRRESLRQLLDRIDRDETAGTDVENNPHVPFAAMTRIHFARWLIFDEDLDGDGRLIPASLVFCSNYDEPREAHLRELIARAGPGLDLIYSHCTGYPDAGHADPDAVLAYFEAHAARVNTFYNGTYGKSVDQIRREAALREAIGRFLDERVRQRRGRTEQPAELRAAIQDFVRRSPELAWALRPPKPTRPPFPGGVAGAAIALLLAIGLVVAVVTAPLRTLLGLLGLVLLAALGLLAWLLALRRLEQQDEAAAWTEKHRPKAPELARREDRVVQNQLSSVINIKPGFVRRWTLRTVLAAINAAARYIFYKGSLGSIPSIHFARWVITDDGRRLAFFSNFDGSWESYLGEFVDRAATGLTAVWGHCVRFPRTRWLILDGARDEQAFKSYARDRQVVTHVWYSAYKTLTVVNITNNSEIRRGLSGHLKPEELAVWLRRL